MLSLLILAALSLSGCVPAAQTQIEIYSPWITGPEAVGLQKVSDQFRSEHPGAEIMNEALNANDSSGSLAGLQTQISSGNGPESIQAGLGQELSQDWIVGGQVVPLDHLYGTNRWVGVLPQSLTDLVSYQGHPYAVPVSIHRANVLFYNAALLKANGIDPASLDTFEGWQEAAETLKAAGITPLALGDKEPWTEAQVFETVLIGTLGPAAYQGLWHGETDWSGGGVTQAIENFRMMLGYVNPDHSALTWDQANQLVIDGKAAMTIMTDWVDADYIAKDFHGYGWTSPPGNQGAFDVFGDSFVIARNAKHPELTQSFLGLIGTRKSQETLNRLQGAICPRTDCDYRNFDPYLRSSAADWKTDIILPSIVQGVAAPESWVAAIEDAVGAFVKAGNIAAMQTSLAKACSEAGACK